MTDSSVVTESTGVQGQAGSSAGVRRTPTEIVERAMEARRRDMLGFEWHEYLPSLTFEQARDAGFLKDDADAADWPAVETIEELDKRAKEYLSFWLGKIEDERGISVQRATMHYTAWKWLLGHPDADSFPGSVHGGDGGWYQRDAYEYIKAQIDSGEWDRLTDASRTPALERGATADPALSVTAKDAQRATNGASHAEQ